MMIRDQQWMELALTQARQAATQDEVPVGAVFVFNDQIVAQGHNIRRSTCDPTAHAEVEVLRKASAIVKDWRLGGTLYVTQEPCPMCAGALVNARVDRLVYGCANPKAGAVTTLFRLVDDKRLNHCMEITSGVCEEDCRNILTNFFSAIRQNKASQTTPTIMER